MTRVSRYVRVLEKLWQEILIRIYTNKETSYILKWVFPQNLMYRKSRSFPLRQERQLNFVRKVFIVTSRVLWCHKGKKLLLCVTSRIHNINSNNSGRWHTAGRGEDRREEQECWRSSLQRMQIHCHIHLAFRLWPKKQQDMG